MSSSASLNNVPIGRKKTAEANSAKKSSSAQGVLLSHSMPSNVGGRRRSQVTFAATAGVTEAPPSTAAATSTARRPSLAIRSAGLRFHETTVAPCLTPYRLMPWASAVSFTVHSDIDNRHYLESPLISLTLHLLSSFTCCNPSFSFDRTQNPRRALTKPSRGVNNNSFDNEKWDMILQVNDVIGDEEGRRYVILDLLGHGTFGQVVKCQNIRTGQLVGIKVIKNQTSYFNQSMMEVTVLDMLNSRFDRDDRHHIVRMLDTFIFRSHLCIVVELLSMNLYELVKQNQYRGFSLALCRIFMAQCLDALQILRSARIIHCDLKPENILLKAVDSPAVKVIDFGSACHEHQTVYTYIQSRFYRSPEVILGLPYSASIDMWSLGCIAAELFLGLPLFPGASNYDQMARIVETLGAPPRHMLDVGKDSATYFVRNEHAQAWVLKTREQFSRDSGKTELASKKYFASTNLEDIILNYPMRSASRAGHLRTSSTSSETPLTEEQRQQEFAHRRCFLDFTRGLLCLNPIERWSPAQAIQHPFITGRPFTGSFAPSPLVRSSPLPAAPRRSNLAASALEPYATSRPRSNTLATLRLHEVPPELQRLAAAVEEGGHPPPSAAKERLFPPETFIDPDTGLPVKTRRGSSFVAPSVQIVERAAAMYGGSAVSEMDETFAGPSTSNLTRGYLPSSRRQSIPANMFASDSAAPAATESANTQHPSTTNVGYSRRRSSMSGSSTSSSLLTAYHHSASPLHQVYSPIHSNSSGNAAGIDTMEALMEVLTTPPILLDTTNDSDQRRQRDDDGDIQMGESTPATVKRSTRRNAGNDGGGTEKSRAKQ